MFAALGRAAPQRALITQNNTRLLTRSIALNSHLRIVTSSQHLYVSRSYSTETETVTVTLAKKPRASKSASTTGSKTTKKSAVKKPVKKTVKKKVVKKAAPKKKKKPVVKKPVKKPKKVPSASAILRQARTKAITDKKTLEAQALINEQPKADLRRSGYTQYVVEVHKERNGASPSSTEDAIDDFKNIADAYKALSSSEKEAYARRANEARALAESELQSWVQTYTPYQIFQANTARTKLRRLLTKRFEETKRGSRYSDTYRNIDDPRQPVKPFVCGYSLFVKDRWASGDFAGLTAPRAQPKLREEWQSVSESEKKRYDDIVKQSRDKYEEECSRAFGAEYKKALKDEK